MRVWLFVFLMGSLASANEASTVIQQYSQTHRSTFAINLSVLYGTSSSILHPSLDLEGLQLRLPPSLCSDGLVPRGEMSCDSGWIGDTAALEKKNQYRWLLAGGKAPDSFIYSKPFIDDSGYSYAYLLVKKGIEPFSSFDWVIGHLQFLKPSELREVMDRYQIHDVIFDAIAGFSDAEIEGLVEGQPVVLTPRWLLVRDQRQLGFSPLNYFAYDTRDLRSSLGEHDLVVNVPGLDCIERIGNACFTYNAQTAVAVLHRYSIVFVCVALLLIATVLIVVVRSSIERRRADRRQRMALQVLSHEFRTPVASLMMLMEELARSAPSDLGTRASGEVFKLQRIIEMSRAYLQSGAAMRFNEVEISSMNDFVAEFANDFDSRVRVVLLDKDAGVRADVFWLRFVLANLIQNAFAHGAEPVVLRLSLAGGQVRVSVEDQGSCEFSSLSEMSAAFAKRSSSNGMGLGLNIVSAVVSEWGGRLEFSPAPTSFSLTLKGSA